MNEVARLEQMGADELREFAVSLIGRLARLDGDNARLNEDNERLSAQAVRLGSENQAKQLKIDQLTHEIATLKRWKFAAKSEQLSGEQRTLFEETIDADLRAIELELDALRGEPSKPQAKQQPKRAPLPADLPRCEIRHEPESTTCGCGCEMRRIGEDIAEKLDYVPGTFTVQRHIRGKWACAACGVLTQAPVPAHVIDKGIPTAGLLAQVLVSKYADHAPLYRQEAMFGRAGLAIPRSTLGAWVGACGVQLQPLVDALRAAMMKCGVLHADETPVQVLVPGAGKTHRAYLWTYGTTQFESMKAVVYDFADGRAGRHAKRFLGEWQGTLVCDDYGGYKALFEAGRITEAGCMAHARRKFHELWANHKSETAHEALKLYGALYEVEREAAELDAEGRRRLREHRSRPIADTLHAWLTLHRQKATEGTAIARAIDYSLKRWSALTRFLADGAIPIDNNWIENRIRTVALGRSNWLFAGSLRAGERAAAVMSLIQSVRLNGHDPYAYLKNVLERLPTQPNSRIDELLPHRWTPLSAN
jgi:transposase